MLSLAQSCSQFVSTPLLTVSYSVFAHSPIHECQGFILERPQIYAIEAHCPADHP